MGPHLAKVVMIVGPGISAALAKVLRRHCNVAWPGLE
jgi:hypothetical protein